MSVVIGLGGNVGTDAEIVERFRRARTALGALRSAPLYRSAPVGPDQPAFLNTAIACASIDLATLHALEARLGRDRAREVRWGPRTIDIDILVWDDRSLATFELTIPHPRLAARRFALAPLAALAGDDFVVPGAGRVGDLLARVAAQDVSEVAATW